MSSGPSVLLVEDHAESRSSLAYVLAAHGYRVLEAATGRLAVRIVRRRKLHAVVLDLKLPDMDGLKVLSAIQEQAPGIPTVVVTGFGSVESAVDAMKLGACDFLTKPIEVDELLSIIDRTVQGARRSGAVSTPKSEAVAEMETQGIIGHSHAMLELFDTIKRIAPHQSTVLILGESGTGKELVARALHALGTRHTGPFVPVNCATLSEPILESEIFGHERGAFTSAEQMKAGVMELAHRGTLFLDEVNEMGAGCQAKLLRAIERREFRRVGGTRKIKVDVNLLASANVDLKGWVATGRFRADLYYRLKVVTVVVPPLRDRKEAIPVLAERFLRDVARQTGSPPRRLAPDAMARIVGYPWPGNIRELKNCMESLTLTSRRPVVEAADLPADLRGASSDEIRLPVGIRLEDAEREIIRRTLEASSTIKDAARVLGIGLRTLHSKIQRFGFRHRRQS